MAAPRLSLTQKEHAKGRKKQRREEAARAARAAEDARRVARVAARATLRQQLEDGELRPAILSLHRMKREGMLPDGEAYEIAARGFARATPPAHRMLLQLAALQQAYPAAPLAPADAELYVRAAAARGQWGQAVRWWRAVELTPSNCTEATADAAAVTMP